MKRISLVRFVFPMLGLALAAAVGGTAQAESVSAGSSWSLGGAARTPLEGGRVVVWDGGSGLSAGLAPTAAPVVGSAGAKSMQMGGFLAWRGESYRLDATLAPSLDSVSQGIGASFGAALGALPGEAGTSYGVRFGAALAGDRFTVNPASKLGLAEVVAPNNDVNLTFTVNHALTPSLSVTGTAEARHTVGATPDGPTGQNRFLFGAGLGYRF